MKKELAKELKDAGFPLRESRPLDRHELRNKVTVIQELCGDVDIELVVFEEVAYHMPTLSELIEACGGRFFHVKRRGEADWYASGYESSVSNSGGGGKSPQEAVAKLYIAINKKA